MSCPGWRHGQRQNGNLPQHTEQVLSEGKQGLVLVPEIGLTPQLLRRFRKRLGIEPR
jgi:primosomal protein N'